MMDIPDLHQCLEILRRFRIIIKLLKRYDYITDFLQQTRTVDIFDSLKENSQECRILSCLFCTNKALDKEINFSLVKNPPILYWLLI
jgi:hypothetical protein